MFSCLGPSSDQCWAATNDEFRLTSHSNPSLSIACVASISFVPFGTISATTVLIRFVFFKPVVTREETHPVVNSNNPRNRLELRKQIIQFKTLLPPA